MSRSRRKPMDQSFNLRVRHFVHEATERASRTLRRKEIHDSKVNHDADCVGDRFIRIKAIKEWSFLQ